MIEKFRNMKNKEKIDNQSYVREKFKLLKKRIENKPKTE